MDDHEIWCITGGYIAVTLWRLSGMYIEKGKIGRFKAPMVMSQTRMPGKGHWISDYLFNQVQFVMNYMEFHRGHEGHGLICHGLRLMVPWPSPYGALGFALWCPGHRLKMPWSSPYGAVGFALWCPGLRLVVPLENNDGIDRLGIKLFVLFDNIWILR